MWFFLTGEMRGSSKELFILMWREVMFQLEGTEGVNRGRSDQLHADGAAFVVFVESRLGW